MSAAVQESAREGIDGSGLRLTEVEALLAVYVEYLDGRCRALTYVLNEVLEKLDEPRGSFSRCALYPDDILADDGRMMGKNVISTSPFPLGWLTEMAKTGRTLAQAAGDRARVEEVVREALTPR